MAFKSSQSLKIWMERSLACFLTCSGSIILGIGRFVPGPPPRALKMLAGSFQLVSEKSMSGRLFVSVFGSHGSKRGLNNCNILYVVELR
jgi:hypothetical protein